MLRLHHQETPSRILRRIREAENDSDMPSLPSMASTDGSEDGHDDGDEDDDAQRAVKPRRSPLADMSSATSSASPAGREFQSKSHQHQNNTDRARNILSPLKLNGSNTRQSPLNTQVNSKLSKGKGKAPSSFDESPKVRSPGGPLSAISSNRTVRPTSQSPHDFRASSVTPSVHVTSRANRPSRRTQALSFEESLPEADHSSQQHQQQSHEESKSSPKSLNFDFTEDSGFPERPVLETSIWSRRSDGHASSRPTPLRKIAFNADTSTASNTSPGASPAQQQVEDVSLPPQMSPSRNDDTYDYTTASPTAANAPARQEDIYARRGSTSSSASGSASEVPQIQVTPAPASMTRARRVLIRSASKERTVDDSIGTTPGMGRRVPSAERRKTDSPSYLIDSKLIEGNTDNMNETTPSRSSRTTPSSSSAPVTAPSTALTSRGYSYSGTPEALATPKPSGTDVDLERRKMHLLSTLRMTALKSGTKGSRYLRGTPHPRDRRARSVTPGIEEEDSTTELDGSARLVAQGDDMTAMSGTSIISEESSNDLTTLPRGNGNTSLPLAGPGLAAEGGIVGASRFNNAKLNNYLHTLNTHLTTENQNLIKTLEETAKEVTRLMRKNEELSRMNGSEEMSAGHHAASAKWQIAEDDEGNVTKEMLQSHRKTSQDISTLREHLTGSTHSKQVEDMAEEIKEKDARLVRLEADLEQRNAEIAAMREDVLKRSRSEAGEDDGEAQAEVDLHQQIFTLRDELAQVKAENTLQINDLAKLRSEQVEQASRHNKAIADLQNRTEELLLELEEKDAIIEEIENELIKQEDDFRAKMTNLEEELCKVMEEQEVQLREARKEIHTLRQAGAKPANDPDEGVQQLRSKIETLEKEMEALQVANEKTEKLLQEATATIASSESAGADANRSADDTNSDKLAFLQRRVEDQESRIAQKEEELQVLHTQLSEAKKQFEADLKALQHEASNAQDAKAQAEHKLSSQAVLLKETEKAFADSEDNLRQTAEELNEARKQLQEVQEEISSLKNEQLEAMSSDLQKKYDAAMREIGNLKHQLAYPPAQTSDAQPGKYSKHDSRDLEIKTLRSSNHELETRVNQLRKQAMLAGASSCNTSVSSMNTPNRTEKSVRFDSVQSMKTPRSATQLLGVSWLDKTGNSSMANATAKPLYAEIDNLNRDIQQYKHLLQNANDEIDDKLRKLESAGLNVISMAKELEHARQKIRELEDGNSGSSNPSVIQELRAVRDELTNERSSLIRRLKDIQEQCRQMSAQLDASRSAQSETQRKLDWQTAQLHRLQGRDVPYNNGELELCMDPSHRDLAAERDAIFAGVAALKRDLNKVQQDAVELGQDLKAAKAGTAPYSFTGMISSSDCTKTSCIALRARSKQEAKGLLLVISHLKAKFTRESYFRADLSHQKLYLSLLIDQKQKIIESTNVTLGRFGLPPPQELPRPRISLRIAAHAVIATVRMEKLSTEWRKQSAVKASLRDAYKNTRGKPFSPPLREM